jgi:hypothetical protein
MIAAINTSFSLAKYNFFLITAPIAPTISEYWHQGLLHSFSGAFFS